jgi:WD40 repeat protein
VWIEEQVNASTVEFLNDGRLAFVDNDRLIVVTLTAGPVQTIALPESKMEVFGDVAIQQPSRWLRIHPDGQTMAGVYDTRTVLWDSASKRVRDLTAPALTAPTSLQWSRGGALAWADPDSGVRVWNDYSGELVDPAPDIDFAITLAFSPDGERLAVCDYSAIYIVDLQRRRSTSSVDLPDTFRPGVAFAPDGRRVAFQGSDGLAIFDGRFREQVRVSSLDEHTSAEYVAFSPDSRWIAAGLGGRHPMLRVWPTGVGAPVTLDADRATHGPQPPAFSSDSRWLASFRKGQSVVLWAAGSWVRERTLSLSGTGRALSFAPEGSRLAVAGDGEAAIWDASTGRKLVTLTSPGSSQATEIAWSPDGKRVVTAADDGVLRFWGASDGHLIASLFTLASSRDWILVAPDGRFDGSDPALNSVVAWRVGNRVAHDKSLSAGHRVRHLWRSLSSITPGQ